MARFDGVTLRAWVDRMSKLHFDISVARTSYPNLQLKEEPNLSVPHVLELSLVDDGVVAEGGPHKWFESFSKEESPDYQHVVLFGDGKIVAVASVKDKDEDEDARPSARRGRG